MPSPAGTDDLPEPPHCGLEPLPPPDADDPVIEAYKRHVDRTLLIANLKLTPEQRAEKLESYAEMLFELRDATKSWRQ